MNGDANTARRFRLFIKAAREDKDILDMLLHLCAPSSVPMVTRVQGKFHALLLTGAGSFCPASEASARTGRQRE